MMEKILETCLHDKHVKLGATMVPFGGFDMPIEYTSIIEEHNAVRQTAGIFDVSHMGEVLVTGKESEQFVNYIFTNDITDAPVGKIYYGMMLYTSGGVVDDLLVYKMDKDKFLLVINAANIAKDVAWIEKQAPAFNVVVENKSDAYGQVAIQGPKAVTIIEEKLQLKVDELAFYTFKEMDYNGETIIVSRTGYTGEDGFEIYGSPSFINEIWDRSIATNEILPCGLGCRDTLRFEVGLPLYGHELSDTITPVEGGLSMFVKLNKADFIGKEAIAKQKEEGIKQKVVGIELLKKAVPRGGYKVEVDGNEIGEVTTGYNSICTGKSVCMALIDAKYAKLSTEVEVRIRKKTFKGIIVKKRFYQKSYKK